MPCSPSGSPHAAAGELQDLRSVTGPCCPPNLASAERATRRRLPTTSSGSAWRPDPPAERHPRAELDALQADLIDQTAKQPKPPASAAEPIGGRWELGWLGWAVVHHGGLDPAAPDADGHLNRVAAARPVQDRVGGCLVQGQDQLVGDLGWHLTQGVASGLPHAGEVGWGGGDRQLHGTPLPERRLPCGWFALGLPLTGSGFREQAKQATEGRCRVCSWPTAGKPPAPAATTCTTAGSGHRRRAPAWLLPGSYAG